MKFWGCDPIFVTCVTFHVEKKSHLEHGYSGDSQIEGVFKNENPFFALTKKNENPLPHVTMMTAAKMKSHS